MSINCIWTEQLVYVCGIWFHKHEEFVAGGEVFMDWEVSTEFFRGHYLETVHQKWTVYGKNRKISPPAAQNSGFILIGKCPLLGFLPRKKWTLLGTVRTLPPGYKNPRKRKLFIIRRIYVTPIFLKFMRVIICITIQN